MRQVVRETELNELVVFSFALMAGLANIAYVYENVFTSIVIVPDGVKPHRSLEELLRNDFQLATVVRDTNPSSLNSGDLIRGHLVIIGIFCEI